MVIANIIFKHINNITIDRCYNVDTRTVNYRFCQNGVIVSEIEYKIYNAYLWKLWDLISTVNKIC